MRRLALPAVVWAVCLASPAVADPAHEARLGFERQIAAWNKGDLEGALAAYWNSPDMTWVNRRGLERGFAPFAEAMRTDAAAAPMGVYAGEVLEARNLSRDSALLVVRWSISRDGARVMGGVSTQLWQRIDGAWRATLEHAS